MSKRSGQKGNARGVGRGSMRAGERLRGSRSSSNSPMNVEVLESQAILQLRRQLFLDDMGRDDMGHYAFKRKTVSRPFFFIDRNVASRAHWTPCFSR